jgi:hypothetical protein
VNEGDRCAICRLGAMVKLSCQFVSVYFNELFIDCVF